MELVREIGHDFQGRILDQKCVAKLRPDIVEYLRKMDSDNKVTKMLKEDENRNFSRSPYIKKDWCGRIKDQPDYMFSVETFRIQDMDVYSIDELLSHNPYHKTKIPNSALDLIEKIGNEFGIDEIGVLKNQTINQCWVTLFFVKNNKVEGLKVFYK